MDKTIYLDLNKVNLYGWEKKKSDLVIDSIVRGIEADDNFEDPVLVYRIDENTYQLTLEENYYGEIDCGHRRAVGHYIANKPLKCVIVGHLPALSKKVRDQDVFNIKDTILEDDDKMPFFDQYTFVKKDDPKYR